MTKRLLLGKFGRLTPMAFFQESGGDLKILCVCDCGSFRDVVRDKLISGHTKSCGCISREGSRLRHGQCRKGSHTPEHRAWTKMFERCYSDNPYRKKYYGDRGISVCERWKTFENFFADMGLRPSRQHSLDRINNDGNYEPGNCRWATKSEQMKNRRKWKIKHG
jgi:hypothetical protein